MECQSVILTKKTKTVQLSICNRITRKRASEALEVKYIEIGGLRVNTWSLAPVNKDDLFLYQTGSSGLQSVTMLRSGQHCSFPSA
jgi:hypothetical protein